MRLRSPALRERKKAKPSVTRSKAFLEGVLKADLPIKSFKLTLKLR